MGHLRWLIDVGSDIWIRNFLPFPYRTAGRRPAVLVLSHGPCTIILREGAKPLPRIMLAAGIKGCAAAAYNNNMSPQGSVIIMLAAGIKGCAAAAHE